MPQEVRELFTPAELNHAIKLFCTYKSGALHQHLLREVIEPALPRINQVTGQENDARYWAYALEHALCQAQL